MTGGRADHWFKPRRYGAGATPVTWQGWATIAAFPLVCAAMVLALFALMPPVAAFILLAILLPAAAYAFIAFARGKTDGQWDSLGRRQHHWAKPEMSLLEIKNLHMNPAEGSLE